MTKRFEKIKTELEERGYIVSFIGKNDNDDMDMYVQLRKKNQEEKYECLVEGEPGTTVEQIIGSHADLYEREDYKNTMDEEWEEE